MLYAEIAVKTKTSLNKQIFTYKIKPGQLPYIRPGVLVLVPFNNKKVEGVILTIKPYTKLTLKQKLKFIDKIIDTRPFLNNHQLELAKTISNYYLSPIGEVIFTMIPPIARRLASKSLYFSNNIYNVKKTKSQSNTYTLYDHIGNRILKYLEIIKRALAKKRGIILLFPKINTAKKYYHFFVNKISEKKIVFYHGNLPHNDKYIKYKEILDGKYNLVIGTRQAIFSPVCNLGLIIIDQPENFTFKEEQSPRYYTPTISKFIQKIQNVNLIFGSNLPQIIDWKKNIEKDYKIICNYSDKILKKIKITIVDLNNEKHIISRYLENQIFFNLKKEKILIYTQKKGEGRGLICLDCNYLFTCHRCNLPQFPYNKKLFCHKCNNNQLIPSFCPVCKGTKLKSYGLTTEKIKKEITTIFPNCKINIIDSNNPLTKEKYLNSDILISTKKIFEYEYKFQLTTMIGLDNNLNIPDYKTEENFIFNLVNLAYITQKEMIIQTYFPDNFLFKNIKNFNTLFNKILIDRKKYFYPPFSKLIKLSFKSKSEKECQKEVQKMYKILNTHLAIKDKHFALIGPNPTYSPKKRDYFYYQIILKYSEKYDQLIKNKLAKVNQLSKWIIDVDPLSLL